jgi:hypothetical protein
MAFLFLYLAFLSLAVYDLSLVWPFFLLLFMAFLLLCLAFLSLAVYGLAFSCCV